MGFEIWWIWMAIAAALIFAELFTSGLEIGERMLAKAFMGKIAKITELHDHSNLTDVFLTKGGGL